MENFQSIIYDPDDLAPASPRPDATVIDPTPASSPAALRVVEGATRGLVPAVRVEASPPRPSSEAARLPDGTETVELLRAAGLRPRPIPGLGASRVVGYVAAAGALVAGLIVFLGHLIT